MLPFGKFLVVSTVFFIGVAVGLVAIWQRRIVAVTAFLQFCHLISMPIVQLLNAVFEAAGFRVVSVCVVFAQ